MNNRQEAQAQTIANVRNLVARDLAWAKQANGYCGEISSQPYLERLPALLEIVDSKAQKITELKNEIALYISSSHIAHNTIAEQAKEIERLKRQLELSTVRMAATITSG